MKVGERVRTLPVKQMPRWNFNEILSGVSVNLIKRRGGGEKRRGRRGIALSVFLGTGRGDSASIDGKVDRAGKYRVGRN